MDLDGVMKELATLSNERRKKYYLGQGAREPLFGVPTTHMKPLYRQIKKNQPLADALYNTGNYDAMYFAGMIADVDIMSECDFNRWIDKAYFYMISDFIVAVTLAEHKDGKEIARRWMDSGEELKMSAGYATYEWMLGYWPDSYFDTGIIADLIQRVKGTIHSMPNRTRYAMNNFLVATGVSYKPLTEVALAVAQEIGTVTVTQKSGVCEMPSASETIQIAMEKGKVGFKRKGVRC